MTDMDMPLPEPDMRLPMDGPPRYRADQIHARDAQWRAIVAAEVAKERERLLSVAVARAGHEAKAAAHHAGTWYAAHEHHLAAHKAMCDLIDAVWPDAAAIRAG